MYMAYMNQNLGKVIGIVIGSHHKSDYFFCHL